MSNALFQAKVVKAIHCDAAVSCLTVQGFKASLSQILGMDANQDLFSSKYVQRMYYDITVARGAPLSEV